MKFRDILKNPSNFTGLVELNSSQILNIQNGLANMLNDLIPFFNKHDIDWAITAGNALGAVRTGDFIPWDEDIDLNMTRSSFEKMVHVFEQELGEKYELRKPGDEYFVYHYPQIHKKDTTFNLLQSDANSKDGLFIDIFILENTFDNKALNWLHGLLCSALLFVDSCMRIDRCKPNMLKHCTSKKVIQCIKRKAALSLPFRFVKLEHWLALTDKCFKLSKNEKSKKVVAPSGAKHFFGEQYERETLLPFRTIKFRDYDWYTLNKVEKYLEQRYGSDYMMPPAENKKEHHAIISCSIVGNKT